MSWNLAPKLLPHFRSKAFPEDDPINHNSPNWKTYRQTLARMRALRRRSTHWRATCVFDLMKQKVDYRDYIRGKFNDLDFMTFDGRGQCFPVEYVNIRGSEYWISVVVCEYPLVVAPRYDSGKTRTIYSLTRTAAVPLAVSSNLTLELFPVKTTLAHYNKVNSNFRCTANDEATTQWWFRGYLTQ